MSLSLLLQYFNYEFDVLAELLLHAARNFISPVVAFISAREFITSSSVYSTNDTDATEVVSCAVFPTFRRSGSLIV